MIDKDILIEIEKLGKEFAPLVENTADGGTTMIFELGCRELTFILSQDSSYCLYVIEDKEGYSTGEVSNSSKVIELSNWLKGK